MKKRVLSLLLALVMCLGMATPALAAGGGFTVTEVVAPKYTQMERFFGGLAKVRVGDSWANYKYGVIDATGKEIVEPAYSEYDLKVLHVGMVAVGVDGKWGLIDATGKEIVAPKYDYVSEFSGDLITVQLDGKYGLIDVTGKEVVAFKYDDIWSVSDGVMVVGVGTVESRKYGLIDATGNEIIEPKYASIESGSPGLAVVRVGDWETRKYGVIDTTGKEVLAPEYDEIHISGLAWVVRNGKVGLFDATGKEIVAPKYDIVSGVSGRLTYGFSAGVAWVRLNGKWGVIDETGKEIVAPKYDTPPDNRGEAIRFSSDGLSTVYLDGKCGLIDTTGKEIIPLKYDEMSVLSGRLAVGYLDDEKVYIDLTTGEEITFKYKEIRALGSAPEVMAVSLDGKWGLIDAVTGEEVLAPKYDSIENSQEYTGNENYGHAFEGLLRVRQDGKYGFIDPTGKEVLAPTYDSIGFFADGLATVAARSYGGGPYLYGVIALTEGEPEKPAQPEVPAATTAQPTHDAQSVNGKSQTPAAYKINSSNYFLLRDVAMMLNGTNAQFNVDYDAATKTILIKTKTAYVPNGTEKGAAPTDSKTAKISHDAVMVDGKEVELTVYKINSSNYFKIRDLGEALGFNVSYDDATKTIVIDPDHPYTPD